MKVESFLKDTSKFVKRQLQIRNLKNPELWPTKHLYSCFKCRCEEDIDEDDIVTKASKLAKGKFDFKVC